MINKQRTLGVVGAALVFLGMFLPIATLSMTSGGVTFFDSLSWWDSGAGFVVLMIFLIVASVVVLFTEYRRYVSLVGGFIAITVIVRLIFTMRDAAHLAELDEVFAQTPMSVPRVVGGTFNVEQGMSIRLTVDPLGWVVMLIGAGIIIYSGLVQQKRVESAYKR